MLRLPDPSKQFQIETDASGWASGAVLKQQDENGEWHPCGYISQMFNPTERRYHVYERELLAVIRAVKTWRHFCDPQGLPTEIICDHENLTRWRKPQLLSGKQAQWSLFLSTLNIKLIHRAGIKIPTADALSRRADLVPTEAEKKEPGILLPDTLFEEEEPMKIDAMDQDQHAEIKIEDENSLEEDIRKSTAQDEFAISRIADLRDDSNPKKRELRKEWSYKDGLLKFKNRVYVGPKGNLRKDIVSRFHDTLTMGHPGIQRTTLNVRNLFWWPGMGVFIKNYILGCPICQQLKIDRHPNTPPLHAISATENIRP